MYLPCSPAPGCPSPRAPASRQIRSGLCRRRIGPPAPQPGPLRRRGLGASRASRRRACDRGRAVPFGEGAAEDPRATRAPRSLPARSCRPARPRRTVARGGRPRARTASPANTATIPKTVRRLTVPSAHHRVLTSSTVVSRRRLGSFVLASFAFVGAGCALVLGIEDGTPRGAPRRGRRRARGRCADVEAGPPAAFAIHTRLSALRCSRELTSAATTATQAHETSSNSRSRARDSGVGGDDLYLAVRSVPTGPFGSVVSHLGAQPAATTRIPRSRVDALTLYFARTGPAPAMRAGCTSLWARRAPRARRRSPHRRRSPGELGEERAVPVGRRNAIYFTSARGPSYDIYRGDLGPTVCRA